MENIEKNKVTESKETDLNSFLRLLYEDNKYDELDILLNDSDESIGNIVDDNQDDMDQAAFTDLPAKVMKDLVDKYDDLIDEVLKDSKFDDFPSDKPESMAEYESLNLIPINEDSSDLSDITEEDLYDWKMSDAQSEQLYMNVLDDSSSELEDNIAYEDVQKNVNLNINKEEVYCKIGETVRNEEIYCMIGEPSTSKNHYENIPLGVNVISAFAKFKDFNRDEVQNLQHLTNLMDNVECYSNSSYNSEINKYTNKNPNINIMGKNADDYLNDLFNTSFSSCEKILDDYKSVNDIMYIRSELSSIKNMLETKAFIFDNYEIIIKDKITELFRQYDTERVRGYEREILEKFFQKFQKQLRISTHNDLDLSHTIHIEKLLKKMINDEIKESIDKLTLKTDHLPPNLSAVLQNEFQNLQEKINNKIETNVDNTLSKMIKHQYKTYQAHVEITFKKLINAYQSDTPIGLDYETDDSCTTDEENHTDVNRVIAHILMRFLRKQKNSAVRTMLSIEDLKDFYVVYETLDINKLFSDTPEPLNNINVLELLLRSTERLHEKTDIKLNYIVLCVETYKIGNDIRKDLAINLLEQSKDKIYEYIKTYRDSKFRSDFYTVIRKLNVKLIELVTRD